MLTQNQVGPQATTASLAPSSAVPSRAGNMGDTIVSELHGRYYEATYRGTKFRAANQAGQVTTAALTASAQTGLCLSNPPGSGVNVVLEKVGLAFLVAFAAAAGVGLAVGYNAAVAVTHTTPIAPQPSLVNGPSGKALVDSSYTTPSAAILEQVLGVGLTGAITVATALFGVTDIEGGLILPPGGFVYIYTSTVSGAAGMMASFDWEEVPV